MPPSLRILVVEDLRDSADSMAFLLKLWGYQSAVVYDGERALEVAATYRPDVVLLDIGLPGMNGYKVARTLRALPGTASAFIVAITGYGQKADVERCKEAGFDRHFLKPVDPAELQRLLANVPKHGAEVEPTAITN